MASSTTEIAELTAALENLNTQKPTTKRKTIQELKDCRALWYKVHVLIYDLRNFREIPEAQARLDRIVDATYIGMPYFQVEEVQFLKSIIVEGEEKTLEDLIEETLHERLERRTKKRVESGDYRVCAAHDLAPIFEKAFDIKPKELAKNEEFLEILGKSGLKLKEADNWKGLPKKSFKKKTKKR